ncbi:GNAT family N-acetyltransferase [Sediminibacterium ginsengisoli]|uniref:Acetyltransferase (GNAT) family protein n=1 Tax=Sediminibacterium ginsengisoli TaxID=413434 RepID=A0A1T4RTC5_9BACT|nr:GNAT family N-acetyltransferase [Sediminibacterium ginsengisoli]SKA19202.1 Acetyltransferase (GNAT) family protein [Sediminibacterium ginsengisoli]
MEIHNSTLQDIEVIFELYRMASKYMKERFYVSFPEFDRKMVEQEIAEGRQWKMLIDGELACIWATTWNDPQIWEEKDAEPSVYIHRITTVPAFRGRHLVKEIVQWAKEYARVNNRKYVRLDTVGENRKLIEHYQESGFRFLGMVQLKDVNGLPDHYKLDKVSLFELDA